MNSFTTRNFIEFIGYDIYDWTVVFGLLFLLVEVIDEIVESRMEKQRFWEIVANIVTQIPYFLTESLIFGVYVFVGFTIYEYIPWKIPVTIETAALAILLADFIYYWEHYFMHKVRLFWLAHSVHHSSPIMNTSTAFRFSMFEPVVAALFHIPFMLLGVHPVLLFAGEILVQAYQFWIHNEVIGKLGPLEWLLNTPSHHRVHHGSDKKYIDKNFGGILIIWDRIFGSFQVEEELPTYGITTPINTTNPVTVQLFEFPALWRDLRRSRGIGDALGYILRPPGWRPRDGE